MNATVPAAGIGEAASRWCVWLLIAAGAAIIFVPLMLTAYLSVFDETIIVFPPKAYTLHWYGQIWPQFGAAIQTSLLTALASVTISLALGVPAGIGLSRYRFRGRGALSTFLLAPATVPGIAIGLGHLRAGGDDRGADELATQRLHRPACGSPREGRIWLQSAMRFHEQIQLVAIVGNQT